MDEGEKTVVAAHFCTKLYSPAFLVETSESEEEELSLSDSFSLLDEDEESWAQNLDIFGFCGSGGWEEGGESQRLSGEEICPQNFE